MRHLGTQHSSVAKGLRVSLMVIRADLFPAISIEKPPDLTLRRNRPVRHGSLDRCWLPLREQLLVETAVYICDQSSKDVRKLVRTIWRARRIAL